MPKKARDYALFLKDILSAIDKIERYTTAVQNTTIPRFTSNKIIMLGK
jgi:uncharacterized protein with HEPN domain